MDSLIKITGGRRLTGEVAASGGKNAVLGLIPASLLANSPTTIENVPDIEDVRVAIAMLKWLGAGVEFRDHVLKIDPEGVNRNDPPYELAGRMRASYYFSPVLMGIFGESHVPMPGGCEIGARPIDQTIKGMEALGASVDTKNGVINASAETLTGNSIYLDMPSVGATINSMLAAVSAEGRTEIHNAAREPHVVDVANFLSSMGAQIRGAGTSTIRIVGVKPLHGTDYTVVPDQIETGTLMLAAAATAGDVTITGAIPTHMEALTVKMLEMGAMVESEDDLIHVSSNGSFRHINVTTGGYPGFPTDLQSPIGALLTTANGLSIITETIFENRFTYLRELERMGANVRMVESTAMITGVNRLTGANVRASDLRSGAALIIAGLMAEGTTYIRNVEYIMRGYDHIVEKLRSLGADIEIVEM